MTKLFSLRKLIYVLILIAAVTAFSILYSDLLIITVYSLFVLYFCRTIDMIFVVGLFYPENKNTLFYYSEKLGKAKKIILALLSVLFAVCIVLFALNTRNMLPLLALIIILNLMALPSVSCFRIILGKRVMAANNMLRWQDINYCEIERYKGDDEFSLNICYDRTDWKLRKHRQNIEFWLENEKGDRLLKVLLDKKVPVKNKAEKMI